MGNCKKIAPKGWHLPTKEEFEILSDEQIGGNEDGRMEKILFDILNIELGGYYYRVDKKFSSKGHLARFWSATENTKDKDNAWYYEVRVWEVFEHINDLYKNIGMSVRLVKD